MKQTIGLLSLCASVALLSSTGLSRPAHQHSEIQAQTQCSPENKHQYYQDFIAHSATTSDQNQALEAAKKYLACPGEPEDTANLNFAVGRLLRKNNAHEAAIPYFIKAASYASKIKTSPETYFYLAEAYEKGSFARLSDIYREKFAGKEETDASRTALANIYQLIDCMIDAYARAVALAGDDWRKLKPPGPGSEIQPWNGDFSQSYCFEALSFWYKVRHIRPDGLTNLIENIVSQPLPPEPTPITSLPPKEKRRH